MSDNIPPELISNILARLPARSLLRSTSVCKSWHSLITSSSFISLHLNLSTANNEARLLMLLRGYSKDNHRDCTVYHDYYVRRDNQNFDEIEKLDPPITELPNFFDQGWRLIGSLNGLVLLFRKALHTILLWNPSIRKTVVLPNPRVLFDDFDDPGCIGFGFLPETNEYKIVKFFRLHKIDTSEIAMSYSHAEIYDLSIDSWRNLDVIDFPYVMGYDACQTYLNSTLHWPLEWTDESHKVLIVTFNMKSEKFGTLMLPNGLPKPKYQVNLKFYNVKENLHTIYHDQRGKQCSLWVMKHYGDPDSWMKQFDIDLSQIPLNPMKFRENGDIFSHLPSDISVYHYVSYDPKTTEVKNVADYDNQVVALSSYMDSLVLINHSIDDYDMRYARYLVDAESYNQRWKREYEEYES